jgi:dinuclear metal center YbgI/SA1388 family protein
VYHPLKTVRRDDPVGAVVLACARNAVAVACAHTNWDVAPGGINDVLAERLGVHDPRPLRVTHREPLVKIAVFVPPGHRDAVLDAMAAAGAGAIGDYDRCGFFAAGQGTFRPLPGARPFQGEIGRIETTPEERLEMVVSEALGPAVVAAMKRAHPYEEVAYDVFPLRNTATEHGIGRVGALAEAVDAEIFLGRVGDALAFPALRAGFPMPDGNRPIRTVAVCGGAGVFLMNDARAAGADAFVTSDVRHHEFVEAAARGLLLVDAGHAATEAPGTKTLARKLADALAPERIAVTFLHPDGEPDPA